MIYSDKCFNCPYKNNIEMEQDNAKAFWRKYHIRYVFTCGAYYHPESPKAEIYQGPYCSFDKHKALVVDDNEMNDPDYLEICRTIDEAESEMFRDMRNK